jgi:hypothetical protein
MEFLGFNCQAWIPMPEDGAFALSIDQDVGMGARTFGYGDDVGFDAGLSECAAMDFSRWIISQLSDVTGSYSPISARDHRGCYLAAWHDAE